jgi:hypothetical protein
MDVKINMPEMLRISLRQAPFDIFTENHLGICGPVIFLLVCSHVDLVASILNGPSWRPCMPLIIKADVSYLFASIFAQSGMYIQIYFSIVLCHLRISQLILS